LGNNSGSSSSSLQGTGVFGFSHSIASLTGAYDLAEDYPTRDDSLTAGDVVMIDPYESGFVRKSSAQGYNSTAVGIYSTNPGFRLSQRDTTINGGRAVPVALAGRVPVKVTNENGPILPGDYLTTSASRPGYAMKATGYGSVIGKALESFSGTEGTVLTFVNISQFTPPVEQLLQEMTNITVTGEITASKVTVRDVLTTQKLVVLDEILTNKIVVNGKIITAGDAPTAVLSTSARQSSTVKLEGNDIAGTIDYRSAGGEVGKQVSITFVKAYSTQPRITVTPTTEASAKVRFYISRSNTGFDINFTEPPLDGDIYSYDYHILQ
jgi:hypothetical protein